MVCVPYGQTLLRRGHAGGGGGLILDEEIATEHYGVGFRMEDTDLRDVVEFTLVEMYNDGTVEKIAANYADQGINTTLIFSPIPT